MKRIGVTGAFGFLGANFIKSLLEEGRELLFSGEEFEIVAFASRNKSNPLFDSSRVRVESLDVLDREDAAGKFKGLDAVAHFAGRVDYRFAAKREVWDTDVLGAKSVFEAALAAGLPRLLYVSSVCALGCGSALGIDSPYHPADEEDSPYDDPRWPTSFSSSAEALSAVDASLAGDYGFLRRMRVAYLDAKLAGWELAKLYARERALPVVTIFPGTAIGAGDIHLAISKLVDKVWEGRLRLSFEGATSFVAARDIARGAVLALAKGRIGDGYVLGGRDEHNMSYVEIQARIAALARAELWFAERRPLVLPRGLLLALVAAAEAAMPKGSLTRALVLSGSLDNRCSSAKACAELGYAPGASLEPAILECRRFTEVGRPSIKRPWVLPLAQRLLMTMGLRGSAR